MTEEHDKPIKMVDVELARRIVTALNELLEVDRAAITLLVRARVPCGQALADHPSVQVLQEGTVTTVGLVGVLNGICGVYTDGNVKGWGPVCAVVNDDDGTVSKFALSHELNR